MSDKFEISYRYTSFYPAAPVEVGPPPITAPVPGEPAASQQPIATPDLSTPSPRSLVRILLNIWIKCAWIIILASAIGQLAIGFNNDHSTLIYQAEQMLNGAKLYVDYTDVAPPIIHHLYMLPILLSEMSGLETYTALKLLTLLAITGSMLACAVIMKHSTIAVPYRKLLLASIGLALLSVSFIHQLYADREHLMIVLSMPFMLLYAPVTHRAHVPRALRILVACMAAVGFSIKPYFYVFYAAVMGYVVWKEQSLRRLYRDVENQIILGWALACFVGIYVFFSAYPLEILPLGRATYAAISWGWGSKLSVMQSELIGSYGLVAIMGTVWLFFINQYKLPRWLGYCWFLLGGGIMSYVFNGGWRYTQYPFMVMALITMSLVIAAIVDHYGLKKRTIATGGRIALGLFLYSFVTVYALPAWNRANTDISFQSRYGHPLESQALSQPITDKLNPHFDSHPKFVLLSTNFWGVNMATQGEGRQHVGRFDYLWMLPGLLEMKNQPKRPRNYTKLFKYTAGSIADDLNRHTPDMVIVDTSPAQRSLPAHYDILGYFQRDADFAESFSHYTLAEAINLCGTEGAPDNCAYHVYYRKTDP